jgi:hypothetical protein
VYGLLIPNLFGYDNKIEKLGGEITVPKQEILVICWFSLAIGPPKATHSP